MPSERFMRLPEQKRILIREAVIAEFSRVPYDKVSINQIIRRAGISRGSFYTYFEDKQDLVRFLVSDMTELISTFCDEELKKNNGDYFCLLLSLFDYMTEFMENHQALLTIARNLLYYQSGLNKKEDARWRERMMDKDSHTEWFLQRVDTGGMWLSTYEEFSCLIPMGLLIVLVSVGQFYEFPERREEIRRFLALQTDILRRGTLKEQQPREKAVWPEQKSGPLKKAGQDEEVVLLSQADAEMRLLSYRKSLFQTEAGQQDGLQAKKRRLPAFSSVIK